MHTLAASSPGSQGPASETCTAYPESPKRVGVGSTRLPKDSFDHIIQIVIGVGEIKPFRKSVDKYTRVRFGDHNLRVGSVVVGQGEEDVPRASVRLPSIQISSGDLGVRSLLIAGEMVPNHRVNLDFSQESPLRFHGPEQQHPHGNADRGIDSFLDAGENRDKHADEEDEHFQRGDPPKLVERVRRRDQVPNRMDDDGRQG